MKDLLLTLVRDAPPNFIIDKFIEAMNFLLLSLAIFFYFIEKFLRDAYRDQFKLKLDAQESYTKLNSFMLSFSHELRNPITSLLGNLNMVLEEDLEQGVLEMVRTSKICSEYLLQLINNILDSGKAEMGSLDISPVPTRAETVVEKVWRISNELLKLKNLKGSLRINHRVPRVLMLDPYRLSQILFNLVGNAVKFTETGTINVILQWISDEQEMEDSLFKPISFESESDDYGDIDEGKTNLLEKAENVLAFLGEGNNLRLKVPVEPVLKAQKGILKLIIKDSGIGMSKESLSNTFSKFSQFATGTYRQTGSGLGLYITREILKKMNGEIRAYSKLGVGSTFVVCIPTYCAPEFDREYDFNTLVRALSEKRLKFFVADDIKFNVDLLVNYVAKFKGEVVGSAVNGNETYTKFVEAKEKRVPIDIILLDYGLSLTDGKEVAKKIRDYEKEKKLKPHLIFMMSGNYDDVFQEMLTNKSGPFKIDCIIKKPIFYEDLIETFANFCGIVKALGELK
jgi:signal transduction histidine kinase/CheY-like chemotaxis protein